ncbi:MAG: Membrane-fusion protein [Labilithrix sp.]|nr:Membrane-fusion protein [Labilithrix sp.]
MPRPARLPLRAALLAGAASLAALGASGCSQAKADAPPETPAPAAFAVRVAEVQRGPVAHPVHGTGVVRLKNEVDLSFKVGGVVTTVLVEEGAVVKRGQVLARVDPTEVEAAFRQAKDSQVKAERDLERVKRLHASGSLPLVELQNAETGASLARAAVDAASFNAARAVIVAPDDGRVDHRAVEVGEIVSPGRPVIHFSGRSRGAVVRLGLTDRDVLRVHEGEAASVVLDARPGTTYAGRITQIATVASPGSGTFDVEVRLDEAPVDLLSGLTAKIAIEHAEAVSAVVPIGALVDGRGDSAAVFVVDGDRARRVPVKVAFLAQDRAALATGLESSASVIEAGSAQLADGAHVRVVP